MLSIALLCVCAFGHVSARSDSGNFLDDKWLAGRWDRFRDGDYYIARTYNEVEEPGTWTPSKSFDQGLDPAKDPCLKIKCSRHKVCVAEDYETATCVSQRRVSFKDANLYQNPRSKCKTCPVVHPSPVCGTDGHTYSTKCKLDYQACITGKKIAVKCSGICPCPSQPDQSSAEKKGFRAAVPHCDAVLISHSPVTTCDRIGTWSLGDQEMRSASQCSCAAPLSSLCATAIEEDGSDLKEVVSRLRDWFRVLHENGNHKRVKFQKPEKNKFEVGASPLCRDPLGWMFSRLDTNFDLQLDQSEIKSLYLDRNEPCSDAFFKSCDTHADKIITSSEWCTCFQRYTDSPCKAELSTISKKQAGKKLLGQYLPSCDEEGYYRPHQCHSSSGQCWCVDHYGNEVAGSRTHGSADCGVILESSGDFSSGDSLFADDDEDSFVLNDQAGMDDEDDEDEDDDDGNDEYLS